MYYTSIHLVIRGTLSLPVYEVKYGTQVLSQNIFNCRVLRRRQN